MAVSGARGTINGVESEPPARTDGDRIHRMSIELRRFTEDRHRRSREFDQQLGSAHYRRARAHLRLTVLTRARAGTLTANWRESLALRPPEHRSTTRFIGDQLAVREVAATPPAAWEPHSGATWRAALETWFDATNDAYTDIDQVWTETQAAHRDRIIQQRAAITRLRTHLGWVQLDTRSSAPPPVGEFPHAAARLHIEAWYRAGLAGGGEAVDWIGWLHEQDSEATRTVLARLGEGEGRRQLEHLPAYWHPPARRSS